MFSRSRSLTARSATVLLIAATFALAGCSKTQKKPETRLAQTGTGAGLQGSGSGWGPGGAPGESEFGDGTGMGRGTGIGANGSGKDGTGSFLNDGSLDGVENGRLSGELSMVHFAYDSYDITDDWKQVLTGHAQWLQAHPAVKVQVEGHCDERGTEEYNISLGQRRADAVRTFLIENGVDGQRITTISYGKMRPMQFDETEESHALNRRAMFLVFEGSGSQVASAGNTTEGF